MQSVFVFGTLRHAPLRRLVLGDGERACAGRLHDHQATGPADGPAGIVLKPGNMLDGLVLHDLSDTERARLDFYAALRGQVPRQAEIDTDQGAVAAVIYTGHSGHDAWRLDDWLRDHAALATTAAQEEMEYFGTRSPEQVAAMSSMIRTRASSRLRAGQGNHAWLPQDTAAGRIDIRARRRAYANFFALDEYDLVFQRFDGSLSGVEERTVFMLQDAAILLPYDPVTDRVLLVEQMRAGPLGRGDRAIWQLEPVAGRIDPGETPQEAAQREALEEAGLTLHGIEEIAQVYPSPSCTSEYYYIFLGLADLPETGGSGFGLAQEGEDIRTHIFSFDALMDLVDRMAAVNAPLVLAANWLARHRDRLRAATVQATG
ncbi:MAG: NUDIX domain-containing protein [Marinibacterium sp.]|nr:NUDIX domain-containing protein [Marinibacterium sp.]